MEEFPQQLWRGFRSNEELRRSTFANIDRTNHSGIGWNDVSDDVTANDPLNVEGQSGGKLALGRYPNYIKLANKVGANSFNLSNEEYTSMSSAERWAANKSVIDAAVKNGDHIIFSNFPSEATAESTFLKEIMYLKEIGVNIEDIPIIEP